MAGPDRWHADRRIVAAGAAHYDLMTPLAAGDRLRVRQLRVSSSAAAELVVYFGQADTDNVDGNRVFGDFVGANSGAAPDLACQGAWAPRGGDRVRIYVSAAAIVHVAAEGDLD